MGQDKADLVSAIETYVAKNPGSLLSEVSQFIRQELRRLADLGKLVLGSDRSLTGESLEVRVYLLFQSMGFDIHRGRQKLEDFVIDAPDGAKTKQPLVLEVKSDRKPTLQREDLRQLDDWVFDLSQEEVARKGGLGGGFDAMAFATSGLVSGRKHHPSPHKGVMIFNAPVGIQFEERKSPCLSPDDFDFVKKRNFCIIPLSVLISLSESVTKGSRSVVEVWEAIHSTCGELKDVSKSNS